MRVVEGILRLFSIERAEVKGLSMAPTLCDGQVIWVRMAKVPLSREYLEKIRGRVVILERDEMPGILLIKRLEKVHGDLIWIEGDNKDASQLELQNDSRKFDWLSSQTIKGVAVRKFSRGSLNA
jgi:phage repressor protein C with HTH and peptisase S24 domain